MAQSTASGGRLQCYSRMSGEPSTGRLVQTVCVRQRGAGTIAAAAAAATHERRAHRRPICSRRCAARCGGAYGVCVRACVGNRVRLAGSNGDQVGVLRRRVMLLVALARTSGHCCGRSSGSLCWRCLRCAGQVAR